MRKVIKADGHQVSLPHHLGRAELERLIGATNILGYELSEDVSHPIAGYVICDTDANLKGRPVNAVATDCVQSYGHWGVVVHGDAVLVPAGEA